MFALASDQTGAIALRFGESLDWACAHPACHVSFPIWMDLIGSESEWHSDSNLNQSESESESESGTAC